MKKVIKNPFLLLVLSTYLVIWIITAINPLYRAEWLLENYPVFFCWGLFVFSYFKFRLSVFPYILLLVFLSFHSFGAHYGYSEVPLGYWLSNYFHFDRPNIYDRIVHFLFGFLFTYPLYDLLKRYSNFSNVWLLILPTVFVLSFSAFYEIIEAVIAWTMPAKIYDPFVGLQGDIWDGYKDMILALTGSVIIGIINTLKYLITRTKKSK